MRREEAIALIRRSQPRLAELGVKHAYLFGSVAQDRADTRSDVDVMIDLDEGPAGRKLLFSAFDVGGIQFELARILDRRVDLVIRSDALRPGRKLRPVAESQLVDVF